MQNRRTLHTINKLTMHEKITLHAGCGGRKLSRVKWSQADWVEYAEKSWGYGRISVKDGSALSFEWVRSEVSPSSCLQLS